ncbi:MAG: exodeoxyribonuclease VII small subunit [Oscillospiraceae bacterium]|jgi:exodeoxyribonuclease VII small subunit|nr:exodeoxyribonuclease VII small subunit [Oscillospiraceae bacterium]
MAKQPTAKQPTFEEAVARIDEIVKALERGDAPLDKSLALFEEGARLIKSCGKLLDDAEQKVLRLSKGEDGMPVETPFDAE